MAQETFLDRLKTEKDELADKVSKLSSYMNTDHYFSLSEGNRILLRRQRESMESYLDILNVRLELLG